MVITKQELANRLEKFQTISRAKGSPLTPQKMAIFRTIAASCLHPKAQEIYDQVKTEFPSISLATVYKNLIRFQEMDLIMEIPIAGDSSRYDAKLGTHSHAVNTETGQVYDLEQGYDLNLPDKIMGKKVKKTDIIYYI